LCWAHLIRNLQGLIDQQHAESIWAQRMLACTRDIFAAWHAYRSGLYDQIALQQALMPVRLALHDLLLIGTRKPWTKLQAFCQDLLAHWDALWTFVRVEGVEPTGHPLGECGGTCPAPSGVEAPGTLWVPVSARRALREMCLSNAF
jgi:transposase